MPRIGRFFVVASLFAASAGSAPASETPISLEDALARAARQNPELSAAAAHAQAQAERTDAVRRMRLPRLAASAEWSHLDLPAAVFGNKLNSGEFSQADFDIAKINSPNPLSHLGTSLSLQLPIDVFGKVGAAAAAMAGYRDATSAATRDAGAEIRLRVIEVYRQLGLVARAVTVTEQALKVAQAREAEIEARVETGGALNADLLRARARRREREADVAERVSQRRAASAGLARLLGDSTSVDYVATDAPPAVTALGGEEGAWTGRALNDRPAIRAAQRKLDAAGALARSERRAVLPDVGAAAQVFDNRIRVDGGAHAWAVGVGVSWTLDPAHGKRLAAALAEERAAGEELRAARDQVRLDVAIAYRQAVAARERHAAAAGGAEEGREALRVIQERRKAGMATLTDELETETAALAAELAEVGAAAEVAIADAALERATGEM